MAIKRAALIAAVLTLTLTARAGPDWKNSTLIKVETVNAWCRHCPDWNQTSYSFKLDDGTVYTAQTHKSLDVTLNGHTKFRLEKDGHVGDYVHILDDAGKDRKLRIIKKEIQPQASTK